MRVEVQNIWRALGYLFLIHTSLLYVFARLHIFKIVVVHLGIIWYSISSWKRVLIPLLTSKAVFCSYPKSQKAETLLEDLEWVHWTGKHIILSSGKILDSFEIHIDVQNKREISTSSRKRYILMCGSSNCFSKLNWKCPLFMFRTNKVYSSPESHSQIVDNFAWVQGLQHWSLSIRWYRSS